MKRIIRVVAVLTAALLPLAACSGDDTSAPKPANPSAEPHGGAWTPAQLGLTAATGDPAIMPSTPGFSPGVIYVNRVYVDRSLPSRLAMTAVITAGAGVTNAYLGVYDPGDGSLLAGTADISASLNQAGIVKAPLAAALPAQPMNKQLYIAVLLGGFAKTPTVIGGREYGSNLGLTDDYRLWVSSTSDNTTLPAKLPRLREPEHGSIPFVAIGP